MGQQYYKQKLCMCTNRCFLISVWLEVGVAPNKAQILDGQNEQGLYSGSFAWGVGRRGWSESLRHSSKLQLFLLSKRKERKSQTCKGECSKTKTNRKAENRMKCWENPSNPIYSNPKTNLQDHDSMYLQPLPSKASSNHTFKTPSAGCSLPHLRKAALVIGF